MHAKYIVEGFVNEITQLAVQPFVAVYNGASADRCNVHAHAISVYMRTFLLLPIDRFQKGQYAPTWPTWHEMCLATNRFSSL